MPFYLVLDFGYLLRHNKKMNLTDKGPHENSVLTENGVWNLGRWKPNFSEFVLAYLLVRSGVNITSLRLIWLSLACLSDS